MQIVNDLWRDECGLVLSAEAVTVGTLGVLGAVVGLNMTSTAVDEELKEFAFAIRSLDQSYAVSGHQSCRAWTAGSSYRQKDVAVSLSELCADGPADTRAIQAQIDSQPKPQLVPARPTKPADDAETTPAPNQIPVPAGSKSPSQVTPTVPSGADALRPNNTK